MNFDLNDEQQKALNCYIAADENCCFEVNKKLRFNLQIEDIECAIRKQIELLDAAFKALPKSTIARSVFRGIDVMGYLEGMEKGDIFRSKEYWSTSKSEDVAVGFIKPTFNHSHVALIEMAIPANLLPVYLPLTNNGEQEILLPRNALWKVTSIGRIEKPETTLGKVNFKRSDRCIKMKLKLMKWSS